MNYQKPRCIYYIWMMGNGDYGNLGDCINPDVAHDKCNLYLANRRKCYHLGNGTWGPGNEKLIKKHKETFILENIS